MTYWSFQEDIENIDLGNDRKMMKNAEMVLEFVFCHNQLVASLAQLVERQTFCVFKSHWMQFSFTYFFFAMGSLISPTTVDCWL
jgi:hypothetical protein